MLPHCPVTVTNMLMLIWRLWCRFHAHTLKLYRAICSHGNHNAAHELTNYVDERQLMFCIKSKCTSSSSSCHYWSHIATHLVHLVLVLFIGATIFKKAQGSVVSNQIGIKFDRIVLQVNAHRLAESDFWFDVKISRWRPWRYFTRKSAAAWRVHTKRLPAYAAALASSWSTVH